MPEGIEVLVSVFISLVPNVKILGGVCTASGASLLAMCHSLVFARGGISLRVMHHNLEVQIGAVTPTPVRCGTGHRYRRGLR
jgi:hypothetical protein